jgi:hypothetical protein
MESFLFLLYVTKSSTRVTKTKGILFLYPISTTVNNLTTEDNIS